MRHLLAVLGVSIVALTVGCASPTEEGGDGSDGVTGDDQNLTQINGQDPQVYYKQFVYRREKRTTGLTGWWHYYPSTIENSKLPNGQYTSLTLYPRADGTFTGEYAEMTARSASEFVHDFDSKPSGRWRVEGTKIVFDGIGTGEGVQVNDGPGFRLTFSQNLHAPGLAGKSTVLKIVAGSWGPDGNRD